MLQNSLLDCPRKMLRKKIMIYFSWISQDRKQLNFSLILIYLIIYGSHFNEFDTYAEAEGLDIVHIIKGVSLDLHISDCYNNPSFSYGRNCLLKDTKQFLVKYANVLEELVRAIVEVNRIRNNFIANKVLENTRYYTASSMRNAEKKLSITIGVYRITIM